MNIKIANKETSEKITRLRLEAYKVASKVKIKDFSFLRWNKLDEASIVLFVENELGQAVSSIRGIYVTSNREIEEVFDIRINSFLEFPILLLDKLTTEVNFRGLGLSGVLRFLFINASLNSNIKNIALTINEGVSRVVHLEEMGFAFEYADVSKRKKSVYVNESKVLFGLLKHSDFLNASTIARANLSVKLSDFGIEQETIKQLNEYLR